MRPSPLLNGTKIVKQTSIMHARIFSVRQKINDIMRDQTSEDSKDESNKNEEEYSSSKQQFELERSSTQPSALQKYTPATALLEEALIRFLKENKKL
jgi:hypothetical protein